MYLKFLLILVYVRGVVVFILYISCMCWYKSNKFNIFFLVFSAFCFNLWDLGLVVKLSDVRDFMWIFFFFAFLFHLLVSNFSLNLFKVSGSLRF